MRFQQIATPASINDILPAEEMPDTLQHTTDHAYALPTSARYGGLWFVYEVSLDDSNLTPILCGISFLDKEEYSVDYPENDADLCFTQLALDYINKGMQSLDITQAQFFVKNVWQAIAEKMALK